MRWPWQKKLDDAPVVADLAPDIDRAAERRYAPGQALVRNYVYPDYMDDVALTALATAKGVSLDPVGLGFTQSTTQGFSSTDEVGAALRTPVSEVSGRTSETVSEETSIGRSLAIQRRHTMRWVVDELTSILRSEGALSEELAVVPATCENELRLGGAVLNALFEWGLSEISQAMRAERQARLAGGSGALPELSEESDAAADVASQPADGFEFDPQDPTQRQLVLAMETLTFAAGDVTREAIVRDVGQMLGREAQTMFALVSMSWGFWDDGSGTAYLWNGGLVTRTEPDVMTPGLSPQVLRVPLDPTKLNPLARARYVHGGYQMLQVLAKIERIEQFGSGGDIVLTPIVILSP